YTGAFLKTVQDIESLVVAIQDGSPVYVRDIATVVAEPADARRLVGYYTTEETAKEAGEEAYSAPAVTIALAKKKGSNGVTVARDILDKVETLKGSVIPDDVHVAVTRNYGQTAKDKVDELIFKLFVATAIVVVLIWAALNFRWEPAVVVMIVIPVVILITVFYALISGYTIDRVSLFALIFSIGILVDDAIVVVENIYRRWLLDESTDTDVAIDAVREVGNPTILATFTVIAALLPMGFVRGMMGPYMEPIPALGSFAMLFSVFAAFIFTPWLAMRIKPSMEKLKEMEESEHRQNEWLGRLFRKTLVPLITRKTRGRLFLVSLFVVFFLSIALFYTQSVPVKMLPLDNKPEFNIVVNMDEGTALPVTANIVNQLADELLKVPEVTALQTYVGTASPFNFNGLVRHYYLRQQPWEADIQVQLMDKSERERSSHEIAQDVRGKLLQVLEGRDDVRIQVVEMPPGPPVLQSVVAEVYGPDDDIRRQVASDLEQMFMRSPNITDVDTLMTKPYQIWRFEVDSEKAVRRGISVDTINRTLRMALGDFVLGDVKSGYKLEPTFIVIQVPYEARADLPRLKEIPVSSQYGYTVPLGELGDFYRGMQEPVIYHKDLRTVEYVTGETTGRLGAPIYGMMDVEDYLKDYTAPDGVELKSTWTGPPETDDQSSFEWAGEWTVTYETFRDMGMAFAAAIILIYMLVVMEFGNFSLPAIIMAPIPLTLVGIIPGHWLFGAEFTATSMIGFIALAGIIVRNSILLVDFTRHEVEAGRPVTESVLLACKARTRPIIVTALALVGGSGVIIFDPIFKGMAISLAFGVLVSTILTLVVIPLGAITVRKAFAPKTIGAGGQTYYGDLPYDPILEGEDYDDLDDGKDKGLLDYLSGGVNFLWIFVASMVLALYRFFRDLWYSLAGLFKRKPDDRQPPPSSPPAP
ncbi:MAG TPA: efflux RND transporter permease subunit, partial [Thiotrichales bacterium]|nr:efflux RND transporter permease subunit [Thiotrichales bacterium]